MDKTHIKQKVILSAVAGMILIPGRAHDIPAAENTGEQPFVQASGIESVLEKCYETEVKDNINLYLVPTEEGEYLNMAFSDTGSAEGYVPSGSLITGGEASRRAKEYEDHTVTVTAYVLNVRDGQGTGADILTQVRLGETYEVSGEPVDGWYPVKVGEIDGWVSGDYVTAEASYSYGETKEEEEARLEAEKRRTEEVRAAEAGAAGSAVRGSGITGQAVIDYACQFIGNPYVWGGTSLTDGADCSGFVQSVYAHFGVSLPRTTYEMVNSGYAVSYEAALPGDLILYDGHVGLYMGDGTIVNAMNEADGIGICSATYTNIIAVRRVL